MKSRMYLGLGHTD